VRYATNDSWEEITALAGPNGFPLLHHADYGSGRLFVLTVPDNFADLYALPAPALDHIRRVVTKGLPVRLQGPSQVSLFRLRQRHLRRPLVPRPDGRLRAGGGRP